MSRAGELPLAANLSWNSLPSPQPHPRMLSFIQHAAPPYLMPARFCHAHSRRNLRHCGRCPDCMRGNPAEPAQGLRARHVCGRGELQPVCLPGWLLGQLPQAARAARLYRHWRFLDAPADRIRNLALHQ